MMNTDQRILFWSLIFVDSLTAEVESTTFSTYILSCIFNRCKVNETEALLFFINIFILNNRSSGIILRFIGILLERHEADELKKTSCTFPNEF